MEAGMLELGKAVVCFELVILYRQIAVFQGGLENPFNDWNDQQWFQGFSWRFESVSFVMPDDDVKAKIYLCVSSQLELRSDAIRTIEVPFTVLENEVIEIASITQGELFKIKRGSYSLLFETGFDDEDVMWRQFSFRECDNPIAKILRADEEMRYTDELCLSAEPT